MSNSATFIPSNQPKSLIVAVIACFTGLGAGAIAFLAASLNVEWLVSVARYLFIASWALCALMFVVFIPKTWAGKYRDLPPRAWKDQVW